MKTVEMPSELDFTKLIKEHQIGIWRYLRVLGCNSSLAEDLTQDTFLAVIEKPFEDLGSAATSAYLRTVARNLFISTLRKKKETVSIDELDYLDTEWSQLASNDQGETLLISLESCLEGLEKKAREAVNRKYRDRESRAEIAEALDLTEDGAKNLLQRAKKFLKECVERKMNVLQK